MHERHNDRQTDGRDDQSAADYYELIPVEISPDMAERINRLCESWDRRNRNNLLVHTWTDAELFPKERKGLFWSLSAETSGNKRGR